jgi:hypothetical protein
MSHCSVAMAGDTLKVSQRQSGYKYVGWYLKHRIVQNYYRLIPYTTRFSNTDMMQLLSASILFILVIFL